MEAVTKATGGAVTPADFFATAPKRAEKQPPEFQEARALGLDPDAIAATALKDAIRAEKARRWLEENREAIEAHNRWVEENELPLARFRMF